MGCGAAAVGTITASLLPVQSAGVVAMVVWAALWTVVGYMAIWTGLVVYHLWANAYPAETQPVYGSALRRAGRPHRMDGNLDRVGGQIQNRFRAGHDAPAGVWVLFALVALLWVDQTDLGEPLKWVVRLAFAVAPILMPLSFFLSVTWPDTERPNAVITLVYAGSRPLP